MSSRRDPMEPARSALGDRYAFEEVLGEGGYASVYRVRNRRLDRVEALKVLQASHPDDPEFTSRFLHETLLAASLDHPNIAPVYESGETGGLLWYTLRCVEGRTLSQVQADRGPFRPGDAARLAIPVLDALAYSHARGVVHRDVKPDNVLVDSGGVPTLFDFGIAKSPRSLTKTRTGILIGTPAFISPEQARGLPVDGRTDLYSLAVTLYHLVSGEYPFAGTDGLQAVILRLTQPPTPLGRHLPGVDPLFEEIVMTALAPAPDDRFSSAAEMKEALEAFLRGETWSGWAGRKRSPPGPPAPPGAPVPAGFDSRGQPSGRRLPAAGWALVGLALAVASVTSVLSLRPGRHDGTAPAAPAVPAAPASSGAASPETRAAGGEALREPEPAPAPRGTPPGSPAAAPPRPAGPLPAETAPGAQPRAVSPPQRLPGDDAAPAGLPASCTGATVNVVFPVGEDGVPRDPKVISRDHEECHPFALLVVREWRFHPALDAGGRAVPSRPIAAAIQF